MSTTTETREAVAHSEFAQMIFYWNSEEVLKHMSMTEGFILADHLDSIGEPDAAKHVIREVWEAEDEGSRDPEPWVNGHGARKAERTGDDRAAEGVERFAFAPRRDWDED